MYNTIINTGDMYKDKAMAINVAILHKEKTCPQKFCLSFHIAMYVNYKNGPCSVTSINLILGFCFSCYTEQAHMYMYILVSMYVYEVM